MTIVRCMALVSGIVLALSCASPQQNIEIIPAEEPRVELADSIPVDPQVTIGRLENGLTYYIRENKKPEKRAELRLVVNAGSILEDEDQQGLAHFVEHMAFNGTRHFAKQELVDYLELIGMRFGPELNAYTSIDETVYMLQVPTDSAALVEKAFLILEDWAQGMTLEDLSQKCGYSKALISRVENGAIYPSPASLEKMVAALGMNLHDLFLTVERGAVSVVRKDEGHRITTDAKVSMGREAVLNRML